MDRITGVLHVVQQMTGTLSSPLSLSGDICLPTVISPESYTGEYEFTPSVSTQVVEINGMIARDNITINPIPSNYGLITWDGSTITVS